MTELGNVFSSVFSSLLEFLALLAMGTVIWALCRRYLAKAERLERGFEPAIILILVSSLSKWQISFASADDGGGDKEETS